MRAAKLSVVHIHNYTYRDTILTCKKRRIKDTCIKTALTCLIRRMLISMYPIGLTCYTSSNTCMYSVLEGTRDSSSLYKTIISKSLLKSSKFSTPSKIFQSCQPYVTKSPLITQHQLSTSTLPFLSHTLHSSALHFSSDIPTIPLIPLHPPLHLFHLRCQHLRPLTLLLQQLRQHLNHASLFKHNLPQLAIRQTSRDNIPLLLRGGTRITSSDIFSSIPSPSGVSSGSTPASRAILSTRSSCDSSPPVYRPCSRENSSCGSVFATLSLPWLTGSFFRLAMAGCSKHHEHPQSSPT